jgi:hypothetical protein
MHALHDFYLFVQLAFRLAAYMFGIEPKLLQYALVERHGCHF